MLGFGKVTCELCQSRVPKRHARRGQDAQGACVCGACYARWDNAGRKCVECGTPVRGLQGAGIFVARRGIGHSDCGGARLLFA
jgi:hypothetical protein